MRSRRWTGVVAATATAATVLLWHVSKGKWSDPLIDSGSEWIVPDALARGALLYRDVVYWFGPVTPYWHAAFFSLFGSSFGTLVLAGVVGSVAVSFALYVALRRVADPPLPALWTALAIPSLLFMPNAGGAILGMGYRMWHAAAFALGALTLATGDESSAPRRRFFLSGGLAGMAGLCRTEWGLIALLGSLIALYWREKRLPNPHRTAFVLGLGFLVVFGVPLAVFALLAGADALVRESPVLLLHLPEETRTHVATAGLRPWRHGLWSLVYGTGVALALYWLVEILALRRADPSRPRRRLPALGALLIVLALATVVLGFPSAVAWSAAPAVCAAACAVSLTQRRGRAAALLSIGCAGLLLFHRRPFFITDGPYVAPPLLFAFVCAAGLMAVLLEREDARQRARLESAFAAVLVGLLFVVFAVRVGSYAADGRVPLGGTDGMLGASRELATEIEGLAALVRRDTLPGDGLAVFPEGAVLNFLAQRGNPLRRKLYIPGYLTKANETELIEELERTRPRAIVIWRRPAGEYGRGLFGLDYGRRVQEWIFLHYEPRSVPAESRRPAQARRFAYLLLRDSAEGAREGLSGAGR